MGIARGADDEGAGERQAGCRDPWPGLQQHLADRQVAAPRCAPGGGSLAGRRHIAGSRRDIGGEDYAEEGRQPGAPDFRVGKDKGHDRIVLESGREHRGDARQVASERLTDGDGLAQAAESFESGGNGNRPRPMQAQSPYGSGPNRMRATSCCEPEPGGEGNGAAVRTAAMARASRSGWPLLSLTA